MRPVKQRWLHVSREQRIPRKEQDWSTITWMLKMNIETVSQLSFMRAFSALYLFSVCVFYVYIVFHIPIVRQLQGWHECFVIPHVVEWSAMRNWPKFYYFTEGDHRGSTLSPCHITVHWRVVVFPVNSFCLNVDYVSEMLKRLWDVSASFSADCNFFFRTGR